jgi:hypothetical protein
VKFVPDVFHETEEEAEAEQVDQYFALETNKKNIFIFCDQHFRLRQKNVA